MALHSDESGSGARSRAKARRAERIAIARSPEFFAYHPPRDFRIEGSKENAAVQFTSAVQTPYRENNNRQGALFSGQAAVEAGAKAVVLLRTGIRHAAQALALCRGIAELGISVVRISLPLSRPRMPAELARADYAVSANIGRTIDATRTGRHRRALLLRLAAERGYEVWESWVPASILYAFSQRARCAYPRECIQPLLYLLRRCGLDRAINTAHPPGHRGSD